MPPFLSALESVTALFFFYFRNQWTGHLTLYSHVWPHDPTPLCQNNNSNTLSILYQPSWLEEIRTCTYNEVQELKNPSGYKIFSLLLQRASHSLQYSVWQLSEQAMTNIGGKKTALQQNKNKRRKIKMYLTSVHCVWKLQWRCKLFCFLFSQRKKHYFLQIADHYSLMPLRLT